MAKAFNPFEHHHHHDHDADHDHAHEPLDPGQRSLADSLKVSFFILKMVMLIMVVVYLCSGIFIVKTGEVAIVLRFGQIVGDTSEAQTIESGKLHFSMPYPIDQVIRIPTSEREFKLMDQFWFTKADQTMTDEQAAMSAGPINPLREGSLITGDANLVHARWAVTYKITSPVDFARNLANARLTNSDTMLAEAEQVIQAVVEEGVVFAVAQASADGIIQGKAESIQAVHAKAKSHAQEVLNRLNSGITLITVRASETAMPQSVRSAYQRVIAAENERGNFIAKAEKERTEMLVGVAGEAHEALWELVKQYELAVEANNKEQAAAIEAAFGKAFAEKKIALADGRVVPISGEVASAISEAESYQNQTATTARREAATFNKLKADYDKNPRIFLSRQWESVRERIFSNPDFETFVLPPSAMRLIISRDPKLEKEREIRRQMDLQAQQSGTPRPPQNP